MMLQTSIRFAQPMPVSWRDRCSLGWFEDERRPPQYDTSPELQARHCPCRRRRPEERYPGGGIHSSRRRQHHIGLLDQRQDDLIANPFFGSKHNTRLTTTRAGRFAPSSSQRCASMTGMTLWGQIKGEQ